MPAWDFLPVPIRYGQLWPMNTYKRTQTTRDATVSFVPRIRSSARRDRKDLILNRGYVVLVSLIHEAFDIYIRSIQRAERNTHKRTFVWILIETRIIRSKATHRSFAPPPTAGTTFPTRGYNTILV